MFKNQAKITVNSSSVLASIALATLYLAALSSRPADAQQPGGSVQAPTSVDYPNRTKKIEDLPNFHTVHPFLYRGGEPTRKGMEQLQDKGVKTVIDLRAKSPRTDAEEAIAHELGMRYINLPMSSKAPTEAQVTTYMKAVDEAKAKNEPLFLHCAHGSDRTGCLVGIWRVSRDDYSYSDAYKEMRKYWFGPQFKELSAAVQKRASH